MSHGTMNQYKKTLTPLETPIQVTEVNDPTLNQVNQPNPFHVGLSVCCSKMTIFIMTAINLTWIVFSIISLCNESNREIRAQCGHSNLWACLCTMTVINGFTTLMNIKGSNNDENSESNLLAVCLPIAGFVWTGVELFQPCSWSKLRDFEVWKMLLILFGSESVIFGFLITIGLCYCVASCCCPSSLNDNKSPPENMV
jgi:hypothetical protein